VRERTPERAAVPVAVHVVDAMPVTAVGKVFKPQLRWDAARRVFAQALAPLANQAIDATVAVGAHGTHGSLATIAIAGVPQAMREQVARQVYQLLSPFVLKHEIVWKDEAGAN
jgi:fatty-acyl-CoA synthase